MALLTLSGLTAPFFMNIKNRAKENEKINPKNEIKSTETTKTKENEIKPRHAEEKGLKEQADTTSSPKKIRTQGSTWEKQPGDWWNTKWGYRQNVTLQGTTANRSNWPTNISVNFQPPAHYDSIRVVNASANREIPYQPWNLTYVNESYLDSATISFMANISTTTERTINIYWSTSSKPLPSYPNVLVFGSKATPQGLKYTISSDVGWTVVLPPTHGGTIQNITHMSGDKLGHTNWTNFGISKHVSTEYNGYWGSANTNNTDYEWRGIIEEQDDLTNHFKQTIFLTYKVRNVPLRNSTDTIAKVNYTYRFYRWGWTVNESITWMLNVASDNYRMHGWVFDQNVRLWDYKDAMFNHTVTNSGTDALSVKGWLDRFEDGTAEDWYLDNWQVNDPRVYEGDFSLGCPGTGETYGYNAYGEAISTTITLPQSPALEFQIWYELADTSDETDTVTVYTKRLGGSWTQQEQYTGSSGWTHETVDLSGDYSAGDKIKVRFVLDSEVGSGSDYVGEGVYIDYFEVTPKDGPEWKVYSDAGAWNYTAFLNGKKPRGIGRLWLANSSTGVTPQNDEWIWQNFGGETLLQNYLLWARSCTLNPSEGDQISSKYAVVPWNPSGSTVSEKLAGFNNTREILWSEINKTKKPRERFKLKVTVNVTDKDNNGIPNAKIGLQDEDANAINYYNYSGTTDKKGEVTFDVKRLWYNITANITSAGKLYRNISIARDFSTLNYTVPTANQTIHFHYLVNLAIHAQTTKESNIQNGLIRLNNTTSVEWNLTAWTNLTGWVDLFIPEGRWGLRINATDTEPEHVWDYFTLYDDTGTVIENVKNYTFSLTTQTEYQLEDLNITTAKKSSELELHDTPSTFESYWGENISGTVILQNKNATPLNGTITWYIFNPEGKCVLDYSDFGIPPENTDQGNRSFEVNTSLLPAGSTYSMKFNGTVYNAAYNKPVPINIFITVDPVPTTLSIEMVWNDGSGGNFWDEKLEIFVDYETYTGTSISSGTIKGRFSKGEFSNTFPDGKWNETGNRFGLTFPHFRQDGAGSYSLRVTTSKRNFTTAEELRSIRVYERPTTLDTLSHVETPWTYKYSFQAKYWDERYNEPVRNGTYSREGLDTITYPTNCSYKVKDQAGNVVKSGKMYYLSENKRYTTILQINGSSLRIGTYTIIVHAGKKAFENKTSRSIIEINNRETEIVAHPPRVEKTYGERIAVRFEYNETDEVHEEYPFGDKNVSGARTKRYTIEGKNFYDTGTFVDLDNGSYLLNTSTKVINKTGTFTIKATINKDHYQSQTIQVTLIIKEVPTISLISEDRPSIPWGEEINISLRYVNGLNNRFIPDGIKNIRTSITNLMLHNLTDKYVFSIDTSLLDVGTYSLDVVLNKTFYRQKIVNTTLVVNHLKISGEYKAKASILKNPLTFDVSSNAKEFKVVLRDVSHHQVLSNAVVMYKVQGLSSWQQMENQGRGTYTTTIPWEEADIDKQYPVKVWVKEVSGVPVRNRTEISGEIKSPYIVSVDYLGGNGPTIAGYTIPQVWFYAMIGAIMIVAIYGSVKLYNYLTTPLEVRKLQKMIEQVEKGDFEYPLMEREEQLKERVEKAFR